ncbi:methyltransferase domain-containing protein [Paenibacillus mesotrionivorans]|uniref:Methyltransferase domain-containing protein n=1 Tax=Paenibacillus mesotrionivorans TaxID=3160968 RepID=A0ACC7P4Q0_9BACL
MRIDIGCGKRPHQNCVGLDRIPGEGVAMVHDFDYPIPIADNSVDFIMASNSLQYAADLPKVMKELYRICRHKAVVCIVAPYAHSTSHMANPRFRQSFNEHSPRYWTRHRSFPGNLEEYYLTRTDTWSLLVDEDPAEAGEPDFRLLKLELFYYPPYQGCYDPLELTILRQSQLNVADQIMYHLVAIKAPVEEHELEWMRISEQLEEPETITQTRSLSRMLIKAEEEPPFCMDSFEPVIMEQKRQKAPRTSNLRRTVRKKNAAAKKRRKIMRKP